MVIVEPVLDDVTVLARQHMLLIVSVGSITIPGQSNDPVRVVNVLQVSGICITQMCIQKTERKAAILVPGGRLDVGEP